MYGDRLIIQGIGMIMVAGLVMGGCSGDPNGLQEEPEAGPFEWTWANPLPQGNRLRDVATNGSDGIAVGRVGAIVMLESGVWKATQSGTSEDLVGTAYNEDGIPYVVGKGGLIMRSRDEGKTWEKVQSGSASTLFDIEFLGSNGIIASGGGLLYSTDGGATWLQGSAGLHVPSLERVRFVGDQRAIAVGSGGVFETVDGGANWTHIAQSEISVATDVAFASPDIGVVLQSAAEIGQSNIWLTKDGGAEWDKVLTVETNNFTVLASLAFLDAQNGVVIGKGMVYHTSDGGVTWTLNDKAKIDRAPFAMTARDENSLVAVGEIGSIAESDDGGATWLQKSSGDPDDLTDIDFASSTIGVAVGVTTEGTDVFYRTTDGGASWARTLFISQNLPRGIRFFDENVGIVVGNNYAAKTTNAGDSWSPVTLPNDNNYRDVAFIDATTYILVSNEGLIIQTQNDGADWSSDLVGQSVKLRSVDFFPGTTIGVAAASSQELFRSVDGGLNWDSLPLETRVEALTCLNANVAFGVKGPFGESEVLRSGDQGETWDVVLAVDDGLLSDVAFADDNVGVAIGRGNTIFTTDGGQTWRPTRPVALDVKSVALPDASAAAIIGDVGIILRGTR